MEGAARLLAQAQQQARAPHELRECVGRGGIDAARLCRRGFGRRQHLHGRGKLPGLRMVLRQGQRRLCAHLWVRLHVCAQRNPLPSVHAH
jgi:hypothetical protein